METRQEPMQSSLSPVLVIGFNRPKLLEEQIQRVIKSGERQIFVAVDGPPEENSTSADLCQKTQAVAKLAERELGAMVCLQTKNLGCRVHVSNALDWFFTHVPEGIILEDDCAASDAFFSFCDWGLQNFRDLSRVGHISGNNFFSKSSPSSDCFIVSNHVAVWGWATWRTRWEVYDEDVLSLEGTALKRVVQQITHTPGFLAMWKRLFQEIQSGKVDTWDFIWQFCLWKEKLLAIHPAANLVENVGFGQVATNTARRPILHLPISRTRHNLPTGPLASDLFVNKRYDFLVEVLLYYPMGKPIRSMLRILWVSLGGIRNLFDSSLRKSG